jgi:5'-3' exonuclease
MGVKHFYYWFGNNFSKYINHVNYGCPVAKDIDNFMIDMNGIIHFCAQVVFKYGNFDINKKMLLKSTFLKKDYPKDTLENQNKVYDEICKKITELVNMVKPKKRIILCIDGTAPLGKQNQQRQRRFKTAIDMTENLNMEFNSSCISTGTKFMYNLSKYIEKYIEEKIETDWKHLKVVFGNELVPGEGEHKAFYYSRLINDDEKYCIYGLDADLIMLSYVRHIDNICVIRENYNDPNKIYDFVDVGSSRTDIIRYLRWKNDHVNFEEKSAINDFVYFCFCTGNDFLPNMPSIEIITNGIEKMIEMYKFVGTNFGHLTKYDEDGNVKIIKNNVKEFLRLVAINEKENFEYKLNKKESFFKDEYLESCSKQINTKIQIDIEKYKSGFMNRYFDMSKYTTSEICNDYIEGTEWVLKYYTSNIPPDWNWLYRHNYSPPASIIVDYTDNYQSISKYPESNKPTDPFLQLLCILHHSSSNLLPNELSHLMTDENSCLRKHYLCDYKIDRSGIRKEWESKIIIPNIDFELFKKEYEKNKKNIKDEDMIRNKNGYWIVYSEFDTFFIEL